MDAAIAMCPVLAVSSRDQRKGYLALRTPCAITSEGNLVGFQAMLCAIFDIVFDDGVSLIELLRVLSLGRRGVVWKSNSAPGLADQVAHQAIVSTWAVLG